MRAFGSELPPIDYRLVRGLSLFGRLKVLWIAQDITIIVLGRIRLVDAAALSWLAQFSPPGVAIVPRAEICKRERHPWPHPGILRLHPLLGIFFIPGPALNPDHRH